MEYVENTYAYVIRIRCIFLLSYRIIFTVQLLAVVHLQVRLKEEIYGGTQ